MKFYLSLYGLFFSLLCNPLSAQVTNYSTNEGLPDNYVYQITQDSLGYIWLATGNGLIRMDESKFISYSKAESKNEKQVVTSLLNFNNSIWFADVNGNIYQLSSHLVKKIGELPNEKIISSVVLDKENILFISAHKGALNYNIKTRKSKKFFLAQEQVNSCLVEKEQLYIASKEGLKIFSIKKGLIHYKKTLFDSLQVTCVRFLNETEMLIGTQKKGVFSYSFSTNRIKPFANDLFNYRSPVKDILIDKYENVWVATFGQGTICYTKKSFNDYTNIKIYNKKNNTPLTYCNQVFEDYEHNIWIASFGNGMSLIKNNYIHSFFNSTNNGRINALESNKTDLFININSYLLRLNSKSIIDTLYQLPSDYKVTCMKQKEGNYLFIGTEQNGLFSLNLKNNEVCELFYDSILNTKRINDLLIVDNQIWVATFDGLFRLNLDGTLISKYSTQNGLRHNLITSLGVTKDGVVLVGTKSNRLFFIKDTKVSEKELPTNNQIVTISTICPLDQDKILIGTLGNGLFLYDNGNFKTYTVKEGLSSNYIYGINRINDKKYLIFSEKEINILNIETDKIETIGKKNISLYGSIPKSQVTFTNNDIYFGTSTKLFVFETKKYLTDNFDPKLGFTKLIINDSLYNLDYNNEVINLPSGTYKIELDFKGVNFSHLDDLQYFYKLEGYDDSWHQSKESYALFKQLKSGKYRFMIKVCHKESCKEKTAHFIIHINKPFWQSLWFIVSCILILIWLVIIAFLAQEHNNKRNKKILEYSIQLKTQEIKLKNNDILESLEFTTLIQSAYQVRLSQFQNDFFEIYLLQHTNSQVKSDLVWIEKKEDKYIFAVLDTQKQGVSAGLLSSWVVSILLSAVKEHHIFDPKLIILHLQDSINSKINFGNQNIDIKLTVGVINTEKKELQICSIGQKTIFIDQNLELNFLVGSNTTIGNHFSNEIIINSTFDLKRINAFYVLTNKIENHKTSDFKTITDKLLSLQTLNAFEEKEQLKFHLNKSLQNEQNQPDEYTLLGIKLTR